MKKWYIDDIFIRHGKIYDRGYYIREDGFVEWAEPDPNGKIHVFPISECFHPAGPFSFEPGDPISVEDGELLGDMCAGWNTVAVESVLFRMDDYPRIGEAYMIGLLADGLYVFAWGPMFPYADRLPLEAIDDGESGFSLHATEEEAREALEAAVEAVEMLRG